MARYLLLILAMTLNLSGKVFEEADKTALNTSVSIELRINGTSGAGKVYFSKFDLNSARLAFKNYMQNKGFYEAGSTENIVTFRSGSFNAKAIFVSGLKGTAIITLETEGEEKPAGEGDTPGIDLKDIPRPKYSKRILCLERLSGKEKSATLIYETKESVTSCSAYYKTIMEDRGWSPQICEAGLMVFEAGNKWCSIFIQPEKVIITKYWKN